MLSTTLPSSTSDDFSGQTQPEIIQPVQTQVMMFYYVTYYHNLYYPYIPATTPMTVNKSTPELRQQPTLAKVSEVKNPLAHISRGPRMCNAPSRRSEKSSSSTMMIKSDKKTSLMIRNIPSKYKRTYMLFLLNRHCREVNKNAAKNSDPLRSAFDFFYLPMDFATNSNLGYAFVNFTNPTGAFRFRNWYQGLKWEDDCLKVCEIAWAKLQGKKELTDHFAQMRFQCATNSYLPVVFVPPRDGWGVSRQKVVGRVTPLANNGRKKMLKYRRRELKKRSEN
ncbi:hypothetical protein ACFE04_012490 [Oxalis oulophora]